MAASPLTVRVDVESITKRAMLFKLVTSFTMNEVVIRTGHSVVIGEVPPVHFKTVRTNSTNTLEVLRDRPWMPQLLVALCVNPAPESAALPTEALEETGISNVLLWSISNHSYEESMMRCQHCPHQHPVSCRITEAGKPTFMFGGWTTVGFVSLAAADDSAQGATLTELEGLAGKTVTECRMARPRLQGRAVASDSEELNNNRTEVSAFGTLARLDGALLSEVFDDGQPLCQSALYGATFPIVLRCNSHYHNSLPFFLHVQLLEFRDGALIGLHRTTSRPIKVVSKFLLINAPVAAPAQADGGESNTAGRKRRRQQRPARRKRRRGLDWMCESDSTERQLTDLTECERARNELQTLQTKVESLQRELASVRQREDETHIIMTSMMHTLQQLQAQAQQLKLQFQYQGNQMMQLMMCMRSGGIGASHA
eukprot:c10112_g1_i1.p1 GENE.c10112_g1_i1~~c10112_g1_i1.p1  ORF type:complete len:426 (-),score=47.71 c10112_g1_i1:131-1408(-)